MNSLKSGAVAKCKAKDDRIELLNDGWKSTSEKFLIEVLLPPIKKPGISSRLDKP